MWHEEASSRGRCPRLILYLRHRATTCTSFLVVRDKVCLTRLPGLLCRVPRMLSVVADKIRVSTNDETLLTCGIRTCLHEPLSKTGGAKCLPSWRTGCVDCTRTDFPRMASQVASYEAHRRPTACKAIMARRHDSYK